MEELIMVEYNKTDEVKTDEVKTKKNTGTKITTGCFDNVEGEKVDLSSVKKKTKNGKK